MPTNNWEKLKAVGTSILIGACIAFLTSLFDGMVQLLQDNGNNICGIAAGMGTYLRQRLLS